jgi:lipoprotein-releasing system permease protein
MIVLEKQRDIGILKSLGASGMGVMQIFLYYSLLLGAVGSGLGLVGGLLFVKYIKEIAKVLSYILRSDVFSPEVYSFYEIPTIVQPMTVFWIIFGALLIAVASGVLPAIRAARLHPVETLRS